MYNYCICTKYYMHMNFKVVCSLWQFMAIREKFKSIQYIDNWMNIVVFNKYCCDNNIKSQSLILSCFTFVLLYYDLYYIMIYIYIYKYVI